MRLVGFRTGPFGPRTRAGVLVVLVALLADCRGEDLSGSSFITMSEMLYSPSLLRIPAGGHVHFRNWGGMVHNAVALDRSWSTGTVSGRDEMQVGEWVDVKFDKPGVYPFYCSFHGSADGKQGMVGVVVVGDAEYLPERAKSGKLEAVDKASGVTRRVPQDYPDIQTAVDAAQPGDLVLVSDGVYREAVTVTTPSVTIRGTDRNKVVLEGEFVRNNGVTIFADAVAVENLTAQNYMLNGLFYTGVTGYRGSYVTAINNGDYGIYAFDSYNGILDHSMGTGSPDAGFYVGGCYPCKTVLDQVIAERNIGGGYSGTNSGGDLYIINSIFRNNGGGGISPNTFDVEPLPPERETTIIGNLVLNNRGTGIGIVGGNKNLVARNFISGSGTNGVQVYATKDRNYYPSTGNVVRDNVILSSGRADLAMSGIGNINNCFAGNVHRTTLPGGLETLQRCSGPRVPVTGDLNAFLGSIRGRNMLFSPRKRFDDDWKRVPHPDPQPSMPGGATAPVVPALKPFERYPLNLDAIKLPTPPRPVVTAAAGNGR